MKKFLSLMIVLLVVMVGFSVVSAADIKVGMVTPDGDHGFTGESVAHAKAEIEAQSKALGFEYKYEAAGEASKQIAAVEAMIQWGANVIILWPIEGEQLRNAAQEVLDAGIALVIYDRLIDGFVPTGEIMGDNVTIGEMAAEYVLGYFEEELTAGETVSYLRFIGDSSTVPTQRSEGFDSVIAASDYAAQIVQLAPDFLTNWSNAIAQEQMENWLNTADAAVVQSLNFVFTHDDEVVDGAVNAITNYAANSPENLDGLYLMVGVGGRRETLDLFSAGVNDGNVELVTYYFSPSFIREAVRLGLALAMGEAYDGRQDDNGTYLIDTIEIDIETEADYRANPVFAERYSIF